MTSKEVATIAQALRSAAEGSVRGFDEDNARTAACRIGLAFALENPNFNIGGFVAAATDLELATEEREAKEAEEAAIAKEFAAN